MRNVVSLLRASASLGLSLLLAACSTLVQVPNSTTLSLAVPIQQAEQGYARVLQRHVNERGEVDFAALRDDSSEHGIKALETYASAIARTPLQAASSGDARLAHMINAYNALSMYNVIDSGIPRSHDGWAKVRFFVLRTFEIGGAKMSLYAFENNIIRKLNDPRVHFALNCSARSCPVLPRTLFSAEKLNDELDRESRNFFANPENLRIDHATRTVFFNAILQFYTEDFAPSHAPDLIAYAQRYSTTKIPADYTVAFAPYDWTIANSGPGAK